MSGLKEQMAIYDICRKFELDNMPKVLVMVQQGFGPHRWVISMGANQLVNDGTKSAPQWKFSKTTERTIIIGRQENLNKVVTDILKEMYKEEAR